MKKVSLGAEDRCGSRYEQSPQTPAPRQRIAVWQFLPIDWVGLLSMHYNRDVRRVFAALLLALCSYSLISPIVLASAASDLPACCRRDGKHRCAMADMQSASLSRDAGARLASPKCALFPHGATLPAVFVKLAGTATASVQALVCHAFHMAPASALSAISSEVGANGKRGPPFLT